MIVEAVRDDGAVMVTDGLAGAVVLPGGQVFYRPKDSLYARGGWEPAPANTPMPAGVDPAKLAKAYGAAIFDSDDTDGRSDASAT